MMRRGTRALEKYTEQSGWFRTHPLSLVQSNLVEDNILQSNRHGKTFQRDDVSLPDRHGSYRQKNIPEVSGETKPDLVLLQELLFGCLRETESQKNINDLKQSGHHFNPDR